VRQTGFALNDRIGWPVVEQRARDAVRELPGDTVLAGFSMGAPVMDVLLPARPDTAAVLLLHSTDATKAGAAAEVFTYPGAGHFYFDADLPDHDLQAAALTWTRVLRTVRRTPHR
jgi:dienelactone hydrolase